MAGFKYANEGQTISYESYDFDHRGNEVEPGTRCKVTISEPGVAKVSFVADEWLAKSILDFLALKRDSDA